MENKDITLREHLGNISRARWSKETAEKRKEHATMMALKRWGTKSTRGKEVGITAPTMEENGNGLAVGGDTNASDTEG